MPTTAAVLKAAPTSPREALIEAHATLKRLLEEAAASIRERQEAATIVDRRRALRATAAAHVEDVKKTALAAQAEERPQYLIEAEHNLQQATAELDFAQERLTRADEAQRASEAGINRQAQEVRGVARSLLAERAGEMAGRLVEIEAQAASLRTEFRALVAATQGMGVNLPPHAVVAYREPLGFDGTEPVINSPEWREERALAQEWRAWVEAAVRDPTARMPS
jgi:hypothetical protein